MYGVDSVTNLPSSYLISSSYTGILRLTPNSSATLLDLDNDISINDEIAEYFHYEDDPSAALETQFVTVSTSDGVMLDMSIRNDAVQFNNLYIKGAIMAPNIVAYQNSSNKFKVDNITMPTDGLDVVGASASGPQSYIIPDNESDANALSDKLSDFFILVNMAETGEETNFQYQNVRNLVSKFTHDALDALSVLPSGSIHWIPVNLEQYKLLLDNENNRHNSDSLKCNTLIRDFLLCDGSVYNSIDFPELAKILNNEQVVYWEHENGNMVPKVHTNNTTGTFRVPDLRSMYLRYLVPLIDKIDIKDDCLINRGKGSKVDSKNWDNNFSNKTGAWEIDSCKNQEIIIDNGLDKHYHFIVLDSNSADQSNTADWIDYKMTFSKATNGTDEWGWDAFNEEAKPLAKYGSMRPPSSTDAGSPSHEGLVSRGCKVTHCSTRECYVKQGPASYIYPPVVSPGNSFCNGIGCTCGYILSAATKEVYQSRGTVALSNYVGQTSWSLSREVPYSEIEWDKYDAMTQKLYTNPAQFINTDSGCYQLENSPEFFACLPLIKI